MILGKLTDLKKYEALSVNFKTAIEYLLGHDLLSLGNGKISIDGDNVYLIRDSYQPREQAECFFENHQKYADLQMVLKGKEGFGYIDAAEATIQITESYNAEKDMAKYAAEPEFIYTLKEGTFAIVFPEDLHMVKIKREDSDVEKVVIKIKL